MYKTVCSEVSCSVYLAAGALAKKNFTIMRIIVQGFLVYVDYNKPPYLKGGGSELTIKRMMELA